jgi:hypothetical protein
VARSGFPTGNASPLLNWLNCRRHHLYR